MWTAVFINEEVKRSWSIILQSDPYGPATVFTDEMLDGGASMSWVTEHALRKPADFETVGYIFSHLKVEAQWNGYLARCAEVGERGVVVGYLLGTVCPIHHIMKELMPVEQFFYAATDYPERIERLAEQMEPFYERLKEIGASSPAEIVFLGRITMIPSLTRASSNGAFLPALRDYAETLHRAGKYLMTHTDGENRRLLPLYLRAGFDIADSVCPYPMTRVGWRNTWRRSPTASRSGVVFPPPCSVPIALRRTSSGARSTRCSNATAARVASFWE